MTRKKKDLIPVKQNPCSIIFAFLTCTLFVGGTLSVFSFDCTDGEQIKGGFYRICMPPPETYNGSLVIWAHGFQDAGTPVQIPEDQLEFGDFSIPEFVTALGFGFATNSYRKTGLAIKQGAEDIVDLVDIYIEQQGVPDNIYLTGASEGGIITTLLAEQRPDLFTGGVAACGPVGNFPLQINYFGDGRVLFEVFFPGLIPSPPFDPPPEITSDWGNFYKNVVEPVIFAPENRHKLDQLVVTAKLPVDDSSEEAYLNSVNISVRDVLKYAVVNIEDAMETLGGFPYDNRWRWYRGSDNDLLINIVISKLGLRVAADPVAVQEMLSSAYSTTGNLEIPLITLHTLLDQQIPYWHEQLYMLKTIESGAFLTKHVNIPIARFEHCNFTAGEAVFAFALLLFYSGDLDLLTGVGSILRGQDLTIFEILAKSHGLPYQIEGQSLQAIKLSSN